MHTVKFDIVIAVLTILNLYKNNFRGLGNDIRQGAWWPYKYKKKAYPTLFN